MSRPVGSASVDTGRILVVDDEPSTARCYCRLLEAAGYRARAATSGEIALALAEEFTPALVLLDINLGEGMSGFDVLAVLRRRGDTPVIMITSRRNENDGEHALKLGANLCLRKPVEPAALLARVRAALENARSLPQRGEVSGRDGPDVSKPTLEGVHHLGPLAVDLDTGIITKPGQAPPDKLTPTETRLLARLLMTPGKVVSTEELLKIGWGQSVREAGQDDRRMVSNCIHRLRSSIKPPAGQTPIIEAIRGFGYRLNVPKPDNGVTGRPGSQDPLERVGRKAPESGPGQRAAKGARACPERSEGAGSKIAGRGRKK